MRDQKSRTEMTHNETTVVRHLSGVPVCTLPQAFQATASPGARLGGNTDSRQRCGHHLARDAAAFAQSREAGNSKLSRVEQVKQFVVIGTPWEPGGDELIPTRNSSRPFAAKYSPEIDKLYAATPAPGVIDQADSG
jgi:long-chain acyl-CoA synthetase